MTSKVTKFLKSVPPIACDFKKEIAEHTDGIHIMAMGDVEGTNRIIEFVTTLISNKEAHRP